MIFKTILFLPIFIFELVMFKLFKIKNSQYSHSTMVNLFCISGGWTNRLINFFLKKKRISNINSIINDKEKNFFENEGYLIKKKFLDIHFIQNFLRELNSLEGYWDGDNCINNKKEKLGINIKSTKFFYKSDDLVNLKCVKELLLNKSIIDSARELLDSEPIINNVSCWHSFVSKEPDKQAAQLWHFDMERPKWIKIFFFLTNCNSKNGPHCFISKTHKVGGIPKRLRMLGYKRLDNELVESALNKDLIKEIICEKGAIVFEDTSGLHKGKQLLEGHRTIFQIEFATSMFGGLIDKIKINKDNDIVSRFNSEIKNGDYISQNFQLK